MNSGGASFDKDRKSAALPIIKRSDLRRKSINLHQLTSLGGGGGSTPQNLNHELSDKLSKQQQVIKKHAI